MSDTPSAGMSPEHERTSGLISHLIPLGAMIVSAGLLGFVASIVMYLMYKDRGGVARNAAANSLNIQICTFIGSAISWILMLVLIGFITLPLVILWAIIVHIIGATKANRGEFYTPSLVPRFVK